MSELLTETDVLAHDVETLRRRVQEALGTLSRLPEVEAHFKNLAQTYGDWKEHVDAWPPLEEGAEAATSACEVSTKACNEAVEGLNARFDTLTKELEALIARRVEGGLGTIRAELFDVVDNAKADFHRRLDQHRSAMESEVAALRRQDHQLQQALSDLNSQTAASITGLENAVRDLRTSVQQRLADLQARDTELEQRLATQEAHLGKLWRTLWVGLAGATLLSVGLSRLLLF